MNIYGIIVFTLLIQFAYGKDDANQVQLKLIESHMNTSAEPCVDFYEYACGNYGKVHQNYHDIVGMLRSDYLRKFGKIIDELSDNSSTLASEYHFVDNVRTYYNSCLSAEDLDMVKTFNWLQSQENITWPLAVLQSEYDSSEEDDIQCDWIRTLAVLRKYGMNGIFVKEKVKQVNAQNSVIIIDVPNIENTFSGSPPMRINGIMGEFGMRNRKKNRHLHEELKAFEAKLNSLVINAEHSNRKLLTLETLSITWLKQYINSIIAEPLNPSVEIYVENVRYLEALTTILEDYEPAFLCRYLLMRFVINLQNKSPNENTCLTKTLGLLQLAMNWLYEKYSPQLMEDKKNIELIFKNLLANFKNILNENANNLSDDILIKLRDETDSMMLKLGNLPRPSTTEKLEEFYSDLHLSDANGYFENYLLLQSFHSEAQHKRLNIVLPQDDSYFVLEDVEAFEGASEYHFDESNVVIVPLSALVPPNYHPEFYDIFKYSAFGSNLGHEIMHGFDNTGALLDQNGMKSSTLMAILDNERYAVHSQCLDWKNPKQTGEKIADFSGVALAYEAFFMNSSNEDIMKVEIHSSPISPERLFFLNYAQTFCGDFAESAYSGDEHPSPHKRTNDALANFIKFGRAYDCALGSPMNPDKKCQIWHNTT